MAILRCKMCGGNLEINDEATVAVCEFCGSKQTVPRVDNEKKIKLFERANRLRLSSEFDKAFGVYESIVEEFPEEAEAYWGLVLCEYGIEYVDDPATGNKIPTCHRSSFDSVMDDPNLDLALEYADVVAKGVYRAEAKTIEEIRKGIIEISSKEDPYDIFICYKETDENGERTIDSVIAEDVYNELIERDYKVFFARITLEDKLGIEYEPYIFSALHSSKIMLVFGTDYEYFNAVWVKNEWSRYLKMMAKGEKKTLIPCYKNIDAYDMPKEFARLQAQDMGKVGSMQDLIRGIGKILPRKKVKEQPTPQPQVIVQSAPQSGGDFFAPILRKASAQLARGEFNEAVETYKKVLDFAPDHNDAIIGIFLAELGCKTKAELENGTKFFDKTDAYKNALDVCNEQTKNELESILAKIKENNYKAIENHLNAGSYEKVKSYIDSLVAYEGKNDTLVMYSFLAKNHAQSIESLILGEPIFDLNGYKELIAGLSADKKKEIDEAIAKQKQNANDMLEKAFTAKEYDRVEALANNYLRYENSEKPYLYTFLAYFGVESLSDLECTTTCFTNKEEYLKLQVQVSEETKERLAYTITKQKERLEEQISLAFENKDYSKAKELCTLYRNAEKGNEQVNLIYLFATFEISTYKEIETYEKPIKGTPVYMALVDSCSEQVKKELDEALSKQAKFLEKIRQEKIEAYELAIQKALDVDNFDLVIKVAKECLIIDPTNERANLSHFLAGKKVKTIEDLYEKLIDFEKEEEYKKLLSVLQPPKKKRICDVLDKIKKELRARIIRKRILIGSIIGAIILITIIALVSWFTSDAYIFGAKTENGEVTITTYRGNEKDVTIPEKIGGKPVTAIGAWAFADCDSLTSIVIPDGIATIDSYAFGGCDSLKSVTLGNGVTTIGDGAFEGCPSLKSIVIPDGVTSIGENAFYFCFDLTNIVIPNSVTTIGESAFRECKSLTSIVIPNSVTTIGRYAFYGCDSLTIYCEAENKPNGWHDGWNSWYCPVVWGYTGVKGITEDGFRWAETTKNITITGYTGNDADIEIPTKINGKPVTSIGEKAFYYCYSLKSIVIPNSVTTIGEGAFSNCSSLTSIVIPNSVTTIGNSAFSGCSSLKSIVIPNSVTTIGEGAFSGCSSLTSIAIPNSVTTIGEGAFHWCESLTIYCEAESQPIGWHNYWNYWDRPVEWGTIAVGTTEDGFRWKETTKGVIITGYTGNGGDVVIPNEIDGKPVVAIGEKAFYDLDKLKSVVIPEGVTTIGEYAFYNCGGLTNIEIPESVKTIRRFAFSNCSSLKSVIIPNGVTTIGNRAFSDCDSLTSIVIPNSVTTIGSSAFNNCKSLTSIFIPDSVTTIGEGAFDYCSSLTICCEAESQPGGWSVNWKDSNCQVIWGAIASGTTEDGFRWKETSDSVIEIIDYTGNGGDIEIPSKINGKPVTIIEEEAFYNCESLTSLVIPNSVTTIGRYAFYFCKSLTSVVIPNGVTIIGNSAFSACSRLESVEIPNSVTTIGEDAFYDCDSLTSIVIPNSVTAIGAWAFSGCSSLKSIVIPNSVTTIGERAFQSCSSLTIYCEAESQPSGWNSDWNYSNRPVVWDAIASGITEDGFIWAETSDSVIKIIDYIGDDENIEIPSEINGKPVTIIGNSAFLECYNLNSIAIPNSITTIGEYAFSSCTNLTKVVIPYSVTTIGRYAFSDCSSLTIYCEAESQPSGWKSGWNYGDRPIEWNYTVAKGTTEDGIDWGRRYDNTITIIGYTGSKKEVIIPSEIDGYPVRTIANNALSGKGLTKLIIPSSITQIGKNAFANNQKLVIYCEDEAITSGWSDGWKGETTPVVWDYNNNDIATNGYIYIENDGVRYVLSDTEAYAEGLMSNKEALIIVDKVTYNSKEYEVTGILNNAFGGESFKTVTLPKTIKTIKGYAFNGCTNLTSIIIPITVLEVGEYAFQNCTALTINCVAEAKPTGWHTSWNATGCTVSWGYLYETGTTEDGFAWGTVADGTVRITGYTGTASKVAVPSTINGNKVFAIGKEAFKNNTTIKEVVLPNGIEIIGNSAFHSCLNLKGINIPSTVTTIGQKTFEGCTMLETLFLPRSVVEVGTYAFSLLQTTIYCEAESKPEGWHENYNPHSTEVVFGIADYGKTQDGFAWVVLNGKSEAKIVAYYGNATSLVIPEAIEGYKVGTIGESSMRGLAITSLVIGSNVHTIENYAFYECKSLKSINIPNNVTTLGLSTFYGCSVVTSVSIGTGLTTTGNYTFAKCTSLESIDLPNNILGIGNGSFDGCSSLASIGFGGATTIGNGAFSSCIGLKTITIPKTISYIGSTAFEGCLGATAIYLPITLNTVGEQAFSRCLCAVIHCEATEKPINWNTRWFGTGTATGAVVWDYLNNEVAEDGCIYIIEDGLRYALKDGKATVVYQLSTITEANIKATITYKGSTYTVTKIGGSAFYDCVSLTTVTIPSTVLEICDRAFEKCGKLKTLFIPSSVTTISSSRVFYYCSDLTIYCEAESKPSGWNSQWNYAGYYAPLTVEWGYTEGTTEDGLSWKITNNEIAITGYTGTASEVIIPKQILCYPVAAIGENAFYECGSLESIEIPDGVTTIGDLAFFKCSSLKSIKIPDGVTVIGYQEFWGCHNLESIVIPNSVTTIEDWAFANCDSLTSIAIPNSVTTIEGFAFEGCDSLTIYCEAQSQPSGWNSDWNYTNCPVVWGAIANGTTEDGFRWAETTKNITITGYTGNDGDIEIPSEINGNPVTIIGEEAFSHCKSLTSIVIPNSVTTIGNDAFSYCSSLTSIVIPNSVTTIGNGAFSACSRLESVEIPNSVTTIGEEAFSYCSSLTSIVIPNSVTSIGSGAFYGCNSLESIEIPDSVTTIETWAFSCCSSLTSIVIPDSITTIKDYAFQSCSSLTSIVIPNSVTVIGNNAFSVCESLISIVIPNSVTTIAGFAFEGCDNLTIYCEAQSQPSGWDSYWNFSNCPVVWGYTGE